MEEAETVLNHDTPVTHCLSLDNREDALKDILEGDNLLNGCVALCEVEQQKEALGGEKKNQLCYPNIYNGERIIRRAYNRPRSFRVRLARQSYHQSSDYSYKICPI